METDLEYIPELRTEQAGFQSFPLRQFQRISAAEEICFSRVRRNDNRYSVRVLVYSVRQAV